VILVKYLLVGYLYGIESERRIEQEIQVNMAYRWFLGENLFHYLFEHILHLCIEKGLVDGKLILTDSTHVKANASFKANVKVLAEHEITDYMERLDLYEAQERKRLEDSGAIRPQRTRCMKKERKKAEKTGTSLICRAMEDMGIRLHTPGTSGGVNYKVKFTREYFKYEKEKDCFICPEGKKLTLRSLEREHYNICRTYRADRKDCRACPMLSRCVSDSHRSRTIRVNIIFIPSQPVQLFHNQDVYGTQPQFAF